MATTVHGVYRDGKVELSEVPTDIQDEARVLVTFVDSDRTSRFIDLRSRGIDEGEAARLRASLATFADDWESPEMDIYDDYDAAVAALD